MLFRSGGVANELLHDVQRGLDDGADGRDLGGGAKAPYQVVSGPPVTVVGDAVMSSHFCFLVGLVWIGCFWIGLVHAVQLGEAQVGFCSSLYYNRYIALRADLTMKWLGGV